MVAWRRLLALGSVAALTLGLLAANAVPGFATAGALYGLTLTPGGQQALVAIDPASGTTSPVANLTNLLPNEDFIGSLTEDPDTRTFHALVSTCNPCNKFSPITDYVVTVQGSRVSLSPPLVTLVGAFAYDPVSSLLWAVTDCSTCSNQSLVTVDPASGVETSLATIPGTTFGPACSLAISPNDRKLYLWASPGGLYTVDMGTHSLSAPVSVSNPLTEIAYDIGSQSLVGLANSVLQQFDRVDPSTGTETALHTVPFNHTAQDIAIDPALHTAFFVQTDESSSGQQSVVSIDDVSGAASTGAPVSGSIGPLAYMGPAGRRDTQAPTASPAPRSATNPDSASGGGGTRLTVRRVVARLERHHLIATYPTPARPKPGYS